MKTTTYTFLDYDEKTFLFIINTGNGCHEFLINEEELNSLHAIVIEKIQEVIKR